MEVAQKDKGHAPRELNLKQHKIIYIFTDILLIYSTVNITEVQTGQPNIFQRERLLPRKAFNGAKC
jgi:hypothetical protein